MILVDTSIWIDHLKVSDPVLAELVRTSQVLVHPFVLGELAMGTLKDRSIVLSALQELPTLHPALNDEVLVLVDREHLYGTGLGYVDAHLLAAALVSPATRIWTRDARFLSFAGQLGLAFEPRAH